MLDAVYGWRAKFDAESNPWRFSERNAGKVRCRTPVRSTIGSRDPPHRKNTEFHELLKRLKIAHQSASSKARPTPTPRCTPDSETRCWCFTEMPSERSEREGSGKQRQSHSTKAWAGLSLNGTCSGDVTFLRKASHHFTSTVIELAVPLAGFSSRM
jgi:hypothetical protein